MNAHPYSVFPGDPDTGEGQLQGSRMRMKLQSIGSEACQQTGPDPVEQGVSRGEYDNLPSGIRCACNLLNPVVQRLLNPQPRSREARKVPEMTSSPGQYVRLLDTFPQRR
jgi:hypothetical protein